MDLHKALYMTEFLKMRQNIGTIELNPVKDTLRTNLYDEFKPKEVTNEVKEVINEIQDKTIYLLKKEDQPVFFPDIPELIEEEKEVVNEIKNIQVSENIDMKGGSTLKSITLNPNYVPIDA
jgi:hypothetical protein